MNTALLHTNSGSIYGSRVGNAAEAKTKIAKEVVKRILWRPGFDPNNPVFISDGSSASYVFCEYMQTYLAHPQDDPLNVWTNNLDVPIQVSCQPNAPDRVAVEVAPGLFRPSYCGTFGDLTEAWIEKHCAGSTCIMAVTGLDAELGPYAKHPEAKKVKAAIMRTASQLVIVADAAKLRQKRDIAAAVSPNEWKRWCDDRAGRVHVLSDRSSHIPCPPNAFVIKSGAVDNRTPDQIEQENHRLLNIKLPNHYHCI